VAAMKVEGAVGPLNLRSILSLGECRELIVQNPRENEMERGGCYSLLKESIGAH
jgi:hypothetical protein